ncbi:MULTISPECIES: ABC transporter ATP-binding protein [unclassified Sphingomonas]|uniref:ABC transporter ATP-binding protein n=1 Tax=unclassified Sphingomonas TaxID=196159 RepID=UPI0006F67E23|nr:MULTISPECIES: ABC transporter ATP-binding protein [unclassified Sphingomonas]KQX20074.1 ABC transporter [Sphingomonas sp. Root1294]KQY67325.1 ABC transporter [Sphingomonas sp. Root50]KRB90701.1 ABC transporter [Sphingomonas sp. Root720]
MVSLAIEALHVDLGGRTILHGIGATVGAGSLLGVIGPNGAGKSTLARAIAGLLAPSAGRVAIDDTDVRSLSAAALGRRIAYLPQGQTVHWPLTVERLVALGRLPHLAPFSSMAAADRAAIERAMARADIVGLRDRIVTELSGGERARALIARALAVEAPVLVVDEPLAALDPGHQLELMTLMQSEAAAGTLVVLILHDLGLAARFCDRLLLLHEGRLVADGGPGAVLTPEYLSDCYNIRAWTGTIEGQPVVLPLARS